MEQVFADLAADVSTTVHMENCMSGKKERTFQRGNRKNSVQRSLKPVRAILSDVIERCNEIRSTSTMTRKYQEDVEDISDDVLLSYKRHTHRMNIKPYVHFINYVPRIVNVVTMATVTIDANDPSYGSKIDLYKIASRCSNAYYAPKRFSAVQLAYGRPRSRVLLFHTGTIVGTGCQGAVAARLTLMKAQKQIYKEAGIKFHLSNFEVINIVGASNLKTLLNCEGLAAAHSGMSNFDTESFVGMTWRPKTECISGEMYSTGKLNLPGAVCERDLTSSFYRILPELLRFSSSSHMLKYIPEEIQNIHKGTRMDTGEINIKTARGRPPKRKAAVVDVELVEENQEEKEQISDMVEEEKGGGESGDESDDVSMFGDDEEACGFSVASSEDESDP